MNLWRKLVLFYLGGGSYMTLEFLWRGRSHGSMFLLGGACFSLLGPIGKWNRPLAMRTAAGAASVTALELATGLLVNRQFQVWDYRSLPLNFRGQICLPYTLLWMPVCLAGMILHRKAESLIDISVARCKMK